MDPLSILIMSEILVAVILIPASIIYARYFDLKHSPKIKTIKELSDSLSIAEYCWFPRNVIYLSPATPEHSIEMTLNHEYMHWVLLRLEGSKASDMIDIPEVRIILSNVDS